MMICINLPVFGIKAVSRICLGSVSVGRLHLGPMTLVSMGYLQVRSPDSRQECTGGILGQSTGILVVV